MRALLADLVLLSGLVAVALGLAYVFDQIGALAERLWRRGRRSPRPRGARRWRRPEPPAPRQIGGRR